jgi:hypothetical protein
MKTSRLAFVRGSVGVCTAGLLTVGCGSDDDDDSHDTHTECTNEIANNHGHKLTISVADKQAGVAKVYDIQGTSAHSHTVSLDADDFKDLAAGTTVILPSSTDAGHAHEIEITC